MLRRVLGNYFLPEHQIICFIRKNSFLCRLNNNSMSRNFQSVLENSTKGLKFTEVMNFSKVALAFFCSKLSVKLHSETGTTFGTLPLRQAIRLPIWKL